MLQSNGRRPNNVQFDESMGPRKEINTALTSNKSEPIIEPKPATKNIAGPPVYYPPGQELFSKSEQSSAAWRAQVINPNNYFILENVKNYFDSHREVMQKLAANMNTNQRVNQKALANPVELLYLCVFHYVVPCHV